MHNLNTIFSLWQDPWHSGEVFVRVVQPTQPGGHPGGQLRGEEEHHQEPLAGVQLPSEGKHG